MKKNIFLLLAWILAGSSTAIAAFIDFDRVTTYEGGAAIPAEKITGIRYRGYTGPSAAGPWTAGNVVTDNMAIVAPDPPPGEVRWYTVDAELDGITSAKGAAMSKAVPFPAPAGPVLRGVR